MYITWNNFALSNLRRETRNLGLSVSQIQRVVLGRELRVLKYFIFSLKTVVQGTLFQDMRIFGSKKLRTKKGLIHLPILRLRAGLVIGVKICVRVSILLTVLGKSSINKIHQVLITIGRTNFVWGRNLTLGIWIKDKMLSLKVLSNLAYASSVGDESVRLVILLRSKLSYSSYFFFHFLVIEIDIGVFLSKLDTIFHIIKFTIKSFLVNSRPRKLSDLGWRCLGLLWVSTKGRLEGRKTIGSWLLGHLRCRLVVLEQLSLRLFRVAESRWSRAIRLSVMLLIRVNEWLSWVLRLIEGGLWRGLVRSIHLVWRKRV